MRAVIAGYGYMGEIRHRVAREFEDLDPVAIVDPKKAGQEAYGLVIEKDFDEVLKRESPDVVFVCTPNFLIPEFCCKALDAGCHAFCEKPPGRNVEDILQMRQVEAAATGQKLMFGFNHRHHPAVQDAKRILESGELGRLLWVRGVYGKSGGHGRGFEQSWRNDSSMSGGGILIDQGIHMLDLFRYFVGDFEDVEGWLATSYWNIGVEDNAFVHLRSHSGVVAQLHSSATLWKHTFQMDLGLEDGYLSIRGLLSKSGSYGRETLVIGRKFTEGQRGAVGIPPEETIYYDYDPSWHVQVEEFIRCIKEGDAVSDSTSMDALRVMELVSRIYAEEKPQKAKLDATNDKDHVDAEVSHSSRTVVVEPEVHEYDIRPNATTAEFRNLLAHEAEVLYEVQDRLISIICPACGHDTSEEIFTVSNGVYHECSNCGSWFVSPRPSSDTLNQWEKESAARKFWDDNVFQASKDKRRQQVAIPRAIWIRQSLELASVPLQIELNGADELLNDALGELEVEVVEGAEALGFFDILDRCSNPSEAIGQISQKISSGGILLGNAWLCSGFDVALLREKHPAVNPLERLNLYTEKGLKLLFESEGFEASEFSTPGVLDLETVRAEGLALGGALAPFARALLESSEQATEHEFIEFLQRNRLSSFARFVMRKK
ncbi:MAG: Gfo/Idh/MocA family oxidoreductase [Verrucomicrobiota bacterium]